MTTFVNICNACHAVPCWPMCLNASLLGLADSPHGVEGIQRWREERKKVLFALLLSDGGQPSPARMTTRASWTQEYSSSQAPAGYRLAIIASCHALVLSSGRRASHLAHALGNGLLALRSWPKSCSFPGRVLEYLMRLLCCFLVLRLRHPTCCPMSFSLCRTTSSDLSRCR